MAKIRLSYVSGSAVRTRSRRFTGGRGEDIPLRYLLPLHLIPIQTDRSKGGEFSSLNQATFHHYRDFWCFDISTHSWDRIEAKVMPSARSGHR